MKATSIEPTATATRTPLPVPTAIASNTLAGRRTSKSRFNVTMRDGSTVGSSSLANSSAPVSSGTNGRSAKRPAGTNRISPPIAHCSSSAHSTVRAAIARRSTENASAIAINAAMPASPCRNAIRRVAA